MPLFAIPIAHCKDDDPRKSKYGISGGECDESCNKLFRMIKARQANTIKAHLQAERSSDLLNKCRYVLFSLIQS